MWSDRSSTNWQGVDPRLLQVMKRAREISGVPFEVSEGMREADRQRQLVAQGKSQTMNSRHLHGNAVDVFIPKGDGGVNWDFESYRPIADAAKQAAQELGYNDFVWGGDWKTLKDGVHFQIGSANRTPQTATTGTQGAASMMQQEQKPRGLLGSLGIQKMEEGAEGETGQRFYNRDSFKDTAAILAQGFGRMGIMGMEEIADSVAKQRTEAKAQNKTIEMLGKMGTPQANSAIEYIKAGGAATDALKIAFAKPEKVTPYTDAAKLRADFDRGLINQDEFEAEMTKPAKTTAKEDQIARLESTGVPRDIAIRIADGSLVVSTHPVTGAATLVDKAELSAQQAAQVTPATGEPVQPEGDGAGVFEGTNPAGALGLSGFGANVLNTVVDAFGAGQPADKIAKASSVLGALSTKTSLGLASEFPGRPSNLTREKIENLTIKPGELGMGPSKALDKAEDMVRTIQQSLESASRVVEGSFSPTDKAAAQTSIAMLTPLLADYQSLLKGLAPQSPTSPNGTTLRPDVVKRLENYP